MIHKNQWSNSFKGKFYTHPNTHTHTLGLVLYLFHTHPTDTRSPTKGNFWVWRVRLSWWSQTMIHNEPPCGLKGVILHVMPLNEQIQPLELKPWGGPEFRSRLLSGELWMCPMRTEASVSQPKPRWGLNFSGAHVDEAVFDIQCFDVNILWINLPQQETTKTWLSEISSSGPAAVMSVCVCWDMKAKAKNILPSDVLIIHHFHRIFPNQTSSSCRTMKMFWRWIAFFNSHFLTMMH